MVHLSDEVGKRSLEIGCHRSSRHVVSDLTIIKVGALRDGTRQITLAEYPIEIRRPHDQERTDLIVY